MLLGRRSGMGLPSIGPTRLFLFLQVGSVIGGDDVDSSFKQSLPDRFVVMGRDVVGKRIGSKALDGVPVIAKPQRPWIDFRRNRPARSEEHTSELQSRGQLVCRLLLEKKKFSVTVFSQGSMTIAPVY